MNENAKKWIEALRSGKFQQAHASLCLIDEEGEKRYCCLGVACELAVDAGVIPPARESEGRFFYADQRTNLPVVVAEWLGLATTAGVYNTLLDSGERSLIGLNDTGKSFAEIADVIESQPPKLFGKFE